MAAKKKHKIVKKGNKFHVMDEQNQTVSQHDSLPEAQDALIGMQPSADEEANEGPQSPNFKQNQKDQSVLGLIQNTLNSRLAKAKDKKKKKKNGSKSNDQAAGPMG